jgi:hypothetical protein
MLPKFSRAFAIKFIAAVAGNTWAAGLFGLKTLRRDWLSSRGLKIRFVFL